MFPECELKMWDCLKRKVLPIRGTNRLFCLFFHNSLDVKYRQQKPGRWTVYQERLGLLLHPMADTPRDDAQTTDFARYNIDRTSFNYHSHNYAHWQKHTEHKNHLFCGRRKRFDDAAFTSSRLDLRMMFML